MTTNLKIKLTYSFTFLVFTALYDAYAGYSVPSTRLKSTETQHTHDKLSDACLNNKICLTQKHVHHLYSLRTLINKKNIM